MTAWSAETETPPAASGDAQSTFDVLELRVVGNTTLDARAIESAVYPFTGPGKRLSDVEAARAALERVYHDRGFGTVFVDIPEQSVDEGIVRLHVTEGRLRQVRVVGARYFSGRAILAALPAVRQGGVPNLPAVQSQITALNTQTPDRVVIPVLKAGPEPGTVDLALRTQDHSPFHGSFELNNQYTLDTAHVRAALAARYDDMFGRLDSLSFQYQEAVRSPAQSRVIAGAYMLRLGDSSLSFQYIDSKSDVATIGTLGILGTGSIYGLHWTQPLSSAGSAQSLSFGVDYKDFGQSILVTSSNGIDTPVKYVNFSAAYMGTRVTIRQQWDWSAILNAGLRGATDNAMQFADKRYQAQPNYLYLRTEGGLVEQLPAKFSIALRLTGQFSADPLISNEQLALGGAASVRGYLEAEELGDSGIRSSLQLGGPPFNLDRGNVQLNEFLFFDASRAILVDALPGQVSHSDLRSWGIGMSVAGFNHTDGILTWAYPLVTGATTLRGASTLLFAVRATW